MVGVFFFFFSKSLFKPNGLCCMVPLQWLAVSCSSLDLDPFVSEWVLRPMLLVPPHAFLLVLSFFFFFFFLVLLQRHQPMLFWSALVHPPDMHIA